MKRMPLDCSIGLCGGRGGREIGGARRLSESGEVVLLCLPIAP